MIQSTAERGAFIDAFLEAHGGPSLEKARCGDATYWSTQDSAIWVVANWCDEVRVPGGENPFLLGHAVIGEAMRTSEGFA